MSERFHLETIVNPGCVRNCNKDMRHSGMANNDICNHVNSVRDSLPVRCVGGWAEQKIYLIAQYLGIFATGMHNKWDDVNYIEVCSGPGRCIDRKSGCEFDGTSLSVIKHKSFKFISKALFFDYDEQVINILNSRIKIFGQETKAKAYKGDYNDSASICEVIKKEININSLCLVVIDPTDCSVPLDFIKDLHNVIPKMDLIINVATGTDYNRNAPNVIADPVKCKNAKSKYERFLGTTTLFPQLSLNDRYKNKFRDAYKKSLQKVGFIYFDIKTVEQFYDIFYASSNPKGLEFWLKAQKYEYDGQASLF